MLTLEHYWNERLTSTRMTVSVLSRKLLSFFFKQKYVLK